MAKTANGAFRINPEVKKRAEEVFQRIGLTPSVAIDMYYRQVIEYDGIPFQIKAPRYNAETMEALYEAREIAKDKTNIYANHDDLIKDLEA